MSKKTLNEVLPRNKCNHLMFNHNMDSTHNKLSTLTLPLASIHATGLHLTKLNLISFLTSQTTLTAMAKISIRPDLLTGRVNFNSKTTINLNFDSRLSPSNPFNHI